MIRPNKHPCQGDRAAGAKENFRVFDAVEFIALVTAYIPPKHKQLIRRYGLYSSRSRGKWEEQEHIVKLAPVGWKEKKELEAVSEEVSLDNTALACGPQPNKKNLNIS